MNSKSKDKQTRIFFVRHTVTEQTGKILYGRSPGVNLSQEGIKQAHLTAQYLSEFEIKVVFSSPLERAVQTAEIIAQHHDLDVTVKEDLIETNTGTWTGMTLDDCYERDEWKLVQKYPSQFKFPQGESYLDVVTRMQNIISDIVSFNEGNSVVIVSHNGTITSTLARYLGVSLDNYESIPCDPGSISEVRFLHGIGTVQSINVLPVERLV